LKAERPTLQAGKDTENNTTNQPSAVTEADAAVTEEVPRMATRRTTRRSAVAKFEETTPVKPAPKQLSLEKQAENDEDKTMVDIDDEDASAGPKASTPVPEPVQVPSPRLTRAKAATSEENPSKLNLFALDDEPKELQVTDSFALGLLKTGSALEQSKVRRTKKTPSKKARDETSKTPSEPVPALTHQLINGATGVQGSTKVRFFARVETPTGKVEVPMTVDDLRDDVDMVQKYAEWMEKEGVQITYHAFKSIFGLAKKV
jgi:hypothetical protein